MNNTVIPEKDIVPFNESLELCSLGFDDPTLCMYELPSRELCLCHLDEDGLYMPDKDFHAPTFSQAFRWFREKYGLYIDLFVDDDKTFGFFITRFTDDARVDSPIYRTKNTYEEAELACLKKLIEIAKQK